MKKILFKLFFLFLLVSPNYFLFAQQENNDSLLVNKNYEDSSCEKIESKNISITKDQFSKSIMGKLISIMN